MLGSLETKSPFGFSEVLDSNYFKGKPEENIRIFKQLCKKYKVNKRELDLLKARYSYLFNQNIFEEMCVSDLDMEIKLYTSKELVIIQKFLYETQISVVEKALEELKRLMPKEIFNCFVDLYIENKLMIIVADQHYISEATIKRRIKQYLDEMFGANL